MNLTERTTSKPLRSDTTAVMAAFGAGFLSLLLMWIVRGRLAGLVTSAWWAAPLLPAAALTGICIIVLRPRWILWGTILASMVIPDFMDGTALPLGFMKLYGHDVAFGYCVVLILVRASVGRVIFRPIGYNKYVALHFAVGVFGLLVGLLIRKNPYDSTFGDFRRAFFYFMNYFVALYLTDGMTDVRILRRTLLAGGFIIIGKGFLQLAAGDFYYRRFGDAAHVLSHFELTFLSFLVFYALAQLFYNPSGRRMLWSVTAATGLLLTIVGNYRAAWLGLIGGVFFLLFYLPSRRKLVLLTVALAGAMFIAVLIYAMWDVQIVTPEARSTIGQEIATKANIQETSSDVNVIWRWQSYANAIDQWKSYPIIGTGLGIVLEFSASTSTGGVMLAQGHRVHNSFLWLLMTLGGAGFAVVMFVQFKYVQIVLRYLRNSAWLEGRLTVLACGAFFFSFVISTCFEIFLESSSPITVLSAMMALTMLIIHYTPHHPQDELHRIEAKLTASKASLSMEK